MLMRGGCLRPRSERIMRRSAIGFDMSMGNAQVHLRT